MPRKSPLRVVDPEESGRKPKPPATVVAAAESGKRLDLLITLRARIARDIDNPNTPSRDLAALSRRLLEIAREIEALEAGIKGDAVGNAAETPDEAWSAG